MSDSTATEPRSFDKSLIVEEQFPHPSESDRNSQDVYNTDSSEELRLVRKCDLHIIPVLFVLYLLSFLDRINIGNAKIEGLQRELHMAGPQYSVALMVFFVPYILLEVPSNLLINKIAPSTWLSTLMFFWGVCTMCQGLVKNYEGLVVCRFLIGVFEAGVFPGCMYLISMYYKRHELQKRWAFFFSSGLVAGAFGGLLAYALAKMDGIGGYSGWRWIFIIEGLATIVYSVIAKLLIPDWPETAKFLTQHERVLVTRRLDHDNGSGPARMDTLDESAVILALSDWKIWVGTLMYLGIAVSGYSTAFFIPTILNGFGFSAEQSQLHTIPLYVVCTFLCLTTAWASDRLRHRYLFIMTGIVIASIGYIILLCQRNLSTRVLYFATFLVLGGVYIVQPMTMVWLTNNMGGRYKRAIGSAVQIGLGNIGGIIGSNIYMKKELPLYHTGYATALGMIWLCGLMATIFYFGMMWENKKRDRGERDHRLEYPDNLGDAHPQYRFVG